MTVLYKLAKGQLSKQHHYDFGLRALKAVLVMAGELKRGSPDLSEVRNISSPPSLSSSSPFLSLLYNAKYKCNVYMYMFDGYNITFS